MSRAADGLMFAGPWERTPAGIHEGSYFIQDRRNAEVWPVAGEDWLIERIFMDGRLREEFVRDEEAGEATDGGEPAKTQPWQVARVEKWMRAVVQFKEILLILMHITGGGPARGEEILTV